MVLRILIFFYPLFLLAQVSIEEIVFEGNKSFPKSDLIRLLKSEEGEEYKAYFTRSDQRVLTNFYKYNGFIDAEVSFRLENYSSDISEKRLIFSVLENQQSVFGNISFSGNKLFSDETLLEDFDGNFKEAFKEEYLFSLETRIRRRYQKAGYVLIDLQLKNTPRSAANESHIIDVLVEIREHIQFHFRKVIASSSNSDSLKSKKRFIEDGLPFKKGDIYDQSLETEYKKYLYDTRLFQSVSPFQRQSELRGDSSLVDSIDLVLTLIERKSNYVGLSAGISTSQNEEYVKRTESTAFFKQFNYELNLDVGKRNWQGEGFDTGLQINPVWYFDENNDFQNFSTKLKLYSRIVNFPFVNYHANIDITALTVRPQLGNLNRFKINYLTSKRLALQSFFDIRFIFDRNDVTSALDSDQLLRLGFSDYNIFSLATSYRIDERDSYVNPKSGSNYLASLKYSIADVLSNEGKDSRYFTINLEWRRYQPLIWKPYITLATNIRYAGILFQDQENKVDLIPKADRLYIGSSLRGYDFSKFGLLEQVIFPELAADSIRYEPIGGRSLFVANFELRFHLAKIVLKDLYLQTFIDIGGLWQSFQEMKLETMRVGYGFGFSYDLSAILIRLDYGFKLRRKEQLNVLNPQYPKLIEGESPGRFEFGISYHF